MSDEPTVGADDDATPQQQFESIKHTNPYGAEYWSARELAPLLGYDSWRRFDSAIERAKIACTNVGQDTPHHFASAVKMANIGSGVTRDLEDYALSRFGCYLVAMNGDPRKPEIAAAQSYFAVQTRRMEELDAQMAQLSDLEQRALIRERVVSSNKKLSQAAQEAGVNSKSFGLFHDAGYQGLYGGMGVREIKQHKGIGQREDLLDRMGRAELAANEFRITQTEQKLHNDQISGQDEAIATHHAVGREIRQTIRRLGGPLPEELPSEPSVRPLLNQRTREQKRLAAQPAQQSQLFGATEDDDVGQS